MGKEYIKPGEIIKGDRLTFDGHGYNVVDKPVPKKKWRCYLGWHDWSYPILGNEIRLTKKGELLNELGVGICDNCETKSW